MRRDPAVGSARRITVLQSFSTPRRTTNPYLTQLLDCIPADVEVLTFSWSRALLGRYDVLHVHWPEVLLRASTAPRTWARRVLFAALMLRLAATRTPVVRTLHNLASHEVGPWSERVLIAVCERRTTDWIRLNPLTPPPTPAPVDTIPLGDYAEWFAGVDVPEPEPGRLLYFGLIRPYKGVEQLLDAFRQTSGTHPRLHVVGNPSGDALVALIRASCAADARIQARLEYVDDASLADEVGRSELVVLPFREMHNSSSVLLALSLGRPVLVPSNAVSEALAAEVGPGWIHTYVGDLTADVLTVTLAAVGDHTRPDGPDLSQRTWERIGRQHRDVYRRATLGARRRRADRGSTAPGRETTRAGVS